MIAPTPQPNSPVEPSPADSAAPGLNVTITEATLPGFVQAFPTGAGTPGATSNLNVERAGQTRPNAVFAKLGTGGRVSLYTQNGGHLLSDLAGYFRSGDAVATPNPPAGTPGALLSGLTIAPQDFNVGYHREDWGYPADVDGDCQDTRAEVLQRDGTSVTLSNSHCSVTGGSWADTYTGTAIIAPTSLEVDHVIPLAVAHRSGGAFWSTVTKALFANDTAGLELRAVDAAQNQAKGDSTPDVWMPPNGAAQCGYAIAWITVNAQWQLTVTQAEHDALLAIIAGC